MNKIKNVCFLQFIDNIGITKDEEDRLKSSHTNIREKLQKSSLSGNIVKTILSGSYKKKTMIKKKSNDEKKTDVDILTIFDYNKEKNPHSLLTIVRNEIEKISEYEGKTSFQKRSIGVELSKTHIDVIPVLETNKGEDKPLYISNKSKDDWEETNPIYSIEYYNHYAKDNNIRPVTKAIKWWKKINKPENYSYPISYALEVLVIDNYSDDDNMFEGLLKTMLNICNYLKTNTYKPYFNDPCKYGNDLFRKMNQASYESFRGKFLKHTEKLQEGLEKSDISKVIEVFGEEFPKCTIFNDEDRNRMKTITSSIRTYAGEDY